LLKRVSPYEGNQFTTSAITTLSRLGFPNLISNYKFDFLRFIENTSMDLFVFTKERGVELVSLENHLIQCWRELKGLFRELSPLDSFWYLEKDSFY
jgi:hypothetical protein